jgi:hypothetical protein
MSDGRDRCHDIFVPAFEASGSDRVLGVPIRFGMGHG